MHCLRRRLHRALRDRIVRGKGNEAIYPYRTNINQFASEKDYPLDFSHFNINGRVFGASGTDENAESAAWAKVNLEAAFGLKNR